MKPAGLLGCGSILPAACREDEERAETSKFPALEVLLEGGGEETQPRPSWTAIPAPSEPRRNSLTAAQYPSGSTPWGSGRGGIREWGEESGRTRIHSFHGLQHLADEQGQGLRGRATPHLSTPGTQSTKAQVC